MKLITTTALALALTVTSGAAIAQREGGYGATAQQPRPMPTQTEQQPQGPSDAGFKIKPSAKALKPIIELQKAVNANDTANIPAKLAEANAAATTSMVPTRRYAIPGFGAVPLICIHRFWLH